MGRLLERLEGVYLLCAGVLLLLLARGEAYTYFMNPRYRWLTLTAGALLCLIGFVIAAHPRHEHHWSRMLVFAPFLAVLLYVVQAAGGFAPATVAPSAVEPPASQAPDGSPAMAPPDTATAGSSAPSGVATAQAIPGGAIPINLGELFVLADSGDAARMVNRYVAQGIVMRHPTLDALGGFALLRTFIYCCAVDATGVGFLTTGTDVENLHDGQWVRVTGRLEPMPDPQNLSALVLLPDTYVTALHQKYRFVAEEVRPIAEPDVPFSYELHDKEPYAY